MKYKQIIQWKAILLLSEQKLLLLFFFYKNAKYIYALNEERLETNEHPRQQRALPHVVRPCVVYDAKKSAYVNGVNMNSETT